MIFFLLNMNISSAELGLQCLPSSPSAHYMGSLSPGDTSQAGTNATV